MSDKHIFIYLDKMIIGSFHGRVPVMGEDVHEKVIYVPFNTFPAKKSETGKLLSQHIHTVYPKQLDGVKGIPRSVTIVYSDELGSLMQGVLDASQKKRAEELAEQNKQLKIELASTRQDLSEARSSLAKAMESIQSIGKNRSGVSSPFDIPPHPARFGNEDNFDTFD